MLVPQALFFATIPISTTEHNPNIHNNARSTRRHPQQRPLHAPSSTTTASPLPSSTTTATPRAVTHNNNRSTRRHSQQRPLHSPSSTTTASPRAVILRNFFTNGCPIPTPIVLFPSKWVRLHCQYNMVHLYISKEKLRW